MVRLRGKSGRRNAERASRWGGRVLRSERPSSAECGGKDQVGRADPISFMRLLPFRRRIPTDSVRGAYGISSSAGVARRVPGGAEHPPRWHVSGLHARRRGPQRGDLPPPRRGAARLVGIDRDADAIAAATVRMAKLGGAARFLAHSRQLPRRQGAACGGGRGAPGRGARRSGRFGRTSSTRANAAFPITTTRRWTCAWTAPEPLDARAIVNEWSEDALTKILRDYGEEKWGAADRARGLRPPPARADRAHEPAGRRHRRRHSQKVSRPRRLAPGAAHFSGAAHRRQRRASAAGAGACAT